MKLYNGMAPNGLRLTVFLAEKRIKIPTEITNPLDGTTRTEAFLEINPLGEIPALQLDSGEVITESLAICRYLEELHPDQPLFGANILDRARIEMWNRRIELRLFRAIGDVGLHEIEFFKDKVEQIPDYAETQRRTFLKELSWLDNSLSDGRTFIAGETFSVADITGAAALMVAQFVKVDIPDELNHFKKWAGRIMSRPSFPKQSA